MKRVCFIPAFLADDISAKEQDELGIEITENIDEADVLVVRDFHPISESKKKRPSHTILFRNPREVTALPEGVRLANCKEALIAALKDALKTNH